MFGKDKKSSDETTLRETLDKLQAEADTLRRTAETYSITDSLYSTAGHAVGAATATTLGCSSTSRYISPLDLEKMEYMISVIYNEVTTVVPHSDGVDIIARTLDGFQCPVEECKRCRYYLPGGVDSCDRTRALATHLLESGTVKIIPPKHIDKGKDT